MSAQPDIVDLALADSALAAVQTLRQQMATARQPKDRIAAANSILDRLGYGRTTRIQADVADREIMNALEAAKRQTSAEDVKSALESAKEAMETEAKAEAKAEAKTEAVIIQDAGIPPLRLVDDLDQDDE